MAVEKVNMKLKKDTLPNLFDVHNEYTYNNIEQEMNMDSDSDLDILDENVIHPFQEELESLPEVLAYIRHLQTYIHRQQLKLKRLVFIIKEHKSKWRMGVNCCDASTQIEAEDYSARLQEAAWGSVEEQTTVAEEVKKAAETAMQQTSFVYEETSGMYFDYSTGYYYNAELGLYYDGNSGIYYLYDEKNKSYHFHSQVEQVHIADPVVAKIKHKKKRKRNKPTNEKKKIKNTEECYESPEEGECSDSSESQDSSGSTSDTEPEAAKAWPPCMRIIVKETDVEGLKVGSLFIVAYTGGTMGREGDHAVSIPDINISKFHAKFSFDELQDKYFILDFGSRNGTYLNGKRLSVAKCESENHEIVHGSVLQVGSTKLLCHIHMGRETCGHCEPGLVQMMPVPAINDEVKSLSSNKECLHKKELKRIRRKFGLENSVLNSSTLPAPGYEDRAQIRRSTVGSQDHHEKTQTASIHEPISSDNKGFRLMTKMGWRQGQALGKESDGCTEPVPLISSANKAGLGSNPRPEAAPTNSETERKMAIWRKTQKRFQKLS